MSGRVRWERVHVGRGLGSTDVCGFVAGGAAFEAVRYDDTAPTYATHYDRDGAPDVGRTFRRRSDAKRWLLARAAGLAEVPQSESVPSILATNLGADVPRPPRGWRIARQRHDVERGNGDVVITTYERNRRRR